MAQHRDTLDTNLIVHYIMGDIPKQRYAVARLLDEADTIHLVPDLAITEAVYVFETHYGHMRAAIASNLKKFLETFDDILDYNRPLFELALPYYEAHPKMSFNDCCMAFYAELGQAEPLFTFDRQLSKEHASAKVLEA